MQVFRRGQGSTKLRRVSLPSRAAVSCIARSLPSSRIAISSSFDSGWNTLSSRYMPKFFDITDSNLNHLLPPKHPSTSNSHMFHNCDLPAE
eukprot:1308574-Amorphochlora_amoeboformis.AAC.2